MHRHDVHDECWPPRGYRPVLLFELVRVTLCVFDPCGHGFDSGPVGTTDFCYPCSVFKDVTYVLAHSDRFPRGQGSSVHALHPLRRTPRTASGVFFQTATAECTSGIKSAAPSRALPMWDRPWPRSWPYPPAPHEDYGRDFQPPGLMPSHLLGRRRCSSPPPIRFPAVSTNPRHNRVPLGSLAATVPVSPGPAPRWQSMDSVQPTGEAES